MIKFDRSVPPRRVFLEASRELSRSPALLVSMTVYGSGGVGSMIAYNGANANGTPVQRIAAASGLSIEHNPEGGILCDQGLYVALAATTSGYVSFYVGEYVPDSKP